LRHADLPGAVLLLGPRPTSPACSWDAHRRDTRLWTPVVLGVYERFGHPGRRSEHLLTDEQITFLLAAALVGVVVLLRQIYHHTGLDLRTFGFFRPYRGDAPARGVQERDDVPFNWNAARPPASREQGSTKDGSSGGGAGGRSASA
jgi:hypothetical protein